MFSARSRPAAELQAPIEKIEQAELGLRVIAGHIYAIPRLRLNIGCEFRVERRIKLIEEFLLRIGLEMQPTPTLAGAAELLGLDELFVRTTYDELLKNGLLEEQTDGTFTITPDGLAMYQKRVVLGPLEEEVFALDFTPELMEIRIPPANASRSTGVPREFLPGFLTEMPTRERVAILEQLKTFVQVEHETQHISRGRSLVKLEVLGRADCSDACALLLVYDTLTESRENLSLRVIEIRTGNRLMAVEEALAGKIKQGKLTIEKLVGPLQDMDMVLAELVGAADGADDPVNWQMLRQQYQAQTRDHFRQDDASAKAVPTPVTELEFLIDHQIRPRFLKMIGEARQKIVIISPWISEAAVDKELLELLQKAADRGVITLIGWGIAQTQSSETKPAPASVLQRLNNIYGPQGQPAVMTWWLGNQHRKNILIDDRALLTGSHNLLSYRGDYQLRGEEATYLTASNVVLQSRSNTAELLQTGAQRAWNRAIQSRDVETDILIRCSLSWLANEQIQVLVDNLNQLVNKPNLSSLILENIIAVLLVRMGQMSEVNQRILQPALVSMQSKANNGYQNSDANPASRPKPGFFQGFLRKKGDG